MTYTKFASFAVLIAALAMAGCSGTKDKDATKDQGLRTAPSTRVLTRIPAKARRTRLTAPARTTASCSI